MHSTDLSRLHNLQSQTVVLWTLIEMLLKNLNLTPALHGKKGLCVRERNVILSSG